MLAGAGYGLTLWLADAFVLAPWATQLGWQTLVAPEPWKHAAGYVVAFGAPLGLYLAWEMRPRATAHSVEQSGGV